MRGRLKYFGVALAAVVAAAIAAPHVRMQRFAREIHAALEQGLGRRVRIGEVRFRLFTGPAFSVDKVVIYDDPAFGIEPMAHVGSLEARPRLWSLWTGRLEFTSIRLEDASINLVKTARWNFESLLHGNLISAFPQIRVANGRINFKFGDTKSVFYLMIDDLNLSPPGRGPGEWNVRFSGQPARTDRPARGFGSFMARGRWDGRRLDMGLEVEKSAMGEAIALVRGEHVGIHGLLSSRLRLAGPLEDLQISGRLDLEDVHRWDLLLPKSEVWRLALQGRLNLRDQKLELESHSASKEALPLSIRFRASEYLAQPHWGVAVNWNQFPAAPLLEVARHMGARIPPGLRLAGAIAGAIGYTGQGSLQGELAFQDAAVTIPDSPPIEFDQARVVFDGGHVRLAPALARTSLEDEAQIEADYAWQTGQFELKISSDAMDVASLRSQVALAAVPWLEQVTAGTWKGHLRYRHGAEPAGWEGRIELSDAQVPLEGLDAPLELHSAVAGIQGERVRLERIRATAGNIAVQGEYRYEPRAARPHHVRLAIADLNAAELEKVLMPTLRRRSGLLARALSFGRAPVPEWLATRRMDGAVQIGALTLGETRLEKLRGHLLWSGPRVDLAIQQARFENGSLAGHMRVNLRGVRPGYRLAAKLKDVDCKAGRVTAETRLETSGVGAELLAKLRLEFSDLHLIAGGEVYTGKGATQPDGTLLVELSSGSREMRVTGTLAQLKMEEEPETGRRAEPEAGTVRR